MPSIDAKPAQIMVESIISMKPDQAIEFWRRCMSYAQQFPEREFWSVVSAVYLSYPEWSKFL